MTTTLARPRWLERPEARIMLQPLAAPSILGYFALGSALIIWGPWFAMAWGTEKDYGAFFPFLLLFGGFGQLAAALWSYRARAAASAALHGSWAAFFLGLGLIYLLATVHTITVPLRGDGWQSLGQWFIYMAVISFTTACAAARPASSRWRAGSSAPPARSSTPSALCRWSTRPATRSSTSTATPE
jgi:succinate-acetate transporter protein